MCKYNKNGCCTGQKNAPQCYYNLNDDCKKYKPSINSVTLKVDAKLNWEKIARYIMFQYQVNETEIVDYINEHKLDFVDVKIG